MVNGYGMAVKSLWNGLATVIVLDGTLNSSNGRTKQVEKILFENQPCRISHTTIKSVNSQNWAAVVTQNATLYIGSQLEIPEGSKIKVTQNGVTKVFVRSGKPAIYSMHQEIPISLYEENA